MSRAWGACLAVNSEQRRDSSFFSRLVTSLSLLKSLMEIHHSPSLGVSPSLPCCSCCSGLGLPAWPHACPVPPYRSCNAGDPRFLIQLYSGKCISARPTGLMET